MVSNVDTAPQQDPVSVVVGQLPVPRGENEGWRTVEPIEPENIQVEVSDGINPDCIEDKQSNAPDLRLERTPVTINSKSVLQVTVALVFTAGSFAIMYTVPGGVNEVGRAIMCDTIAFKVFLVANMIAFHASLAVGMIVATVSRISAEIDYFVRITLWTAGVCFLLTFHAAAYVVVLPSHKWIVLYFGGAVTIALAMVLLYRLPIMFYQVSEMIWDGFLRSRFKGQQKMTTLEK